MNQIRSLHIEHVSPIRLMRSEISRPANKKISSEKSLTAMRRWFWTRKPDAGFLLEDFPATLLQAIVFDEWLDARAEALDAVIAASNAEKSMIEYYSNQGLLIEDTPVLAP